MMTRLEFERALPTMKPGEVIVYHTGNLLKDRNMGPDFMRVENVARAAWVAMEAGELHLVQIKKGDDVWDYCGIMRPKPFKKIKWDGCYDPRRNHHVKPTVEDIAIKVANDPLAKVVQENRGGPRAKAPEPVPDAQPRGPAHGLALV
jgi:hypothetical protein